MLTESEQQTQFEDFSNRFNHSTAKTVALVVNYKNEILAQENNFKLRGEATCHSIDFKSSVGLVPAGIVYCPPRRASYPIVDKNEFKQFNAELVLDVSKDYGYLFTAFLVLL